MRIKHIRINQWRHFENIELELPDEAGLVCLVGANGTGKSHFLELIASCAHKLGFSEGSDIPRGDPFADPHDFSLQFSVATGVSPDVDLLGQTQGLQWDRVLTLDSRRGEEGTITTTVTAGGIIDHDASTRFGHEVVNALRQSKDVHFLSLDSDRAYPKKTLHPNEVATAYDTDWTAAEFTRGRSFRASTTLYEEWTRYFLAKENQSGTQLIAEIRRARQRHDAEPTFEDHFNAYKLALEKVLPHLVFVGVDSKRRTLVFDTTGLALTFDQLSGGEREIAFLIGQIDRFALRHGLFLIDEPELHLNADLIRTWIAYLTGTVLTGQIWLATHSLEAVEAAGQQATFVLERNDETRKVDSLVRLDTLPVVSALSRAVGTPAFSISKLLFVFVEGEDGVGERERFRNLSGLYHKVRFIMCGSCTEVLRRVAVVRDLARESGAQIRIGGVIDRDFLSDAKATELARDNDVFVLPVHEIENFFLDPATLSVLIAQHGRAELNPLHLIRVASDARAGSWIFQYAMATPNARPLSEISVAAKGLAKSLSWQEIEANRENVIGRIVGASNYEVDERQVLTGILSVGANAYQRKREQADFWKHCEGKQVLNAIAGDLGFAGSSALTRASFATWERDNLRISPELGEFRGYLARRL